jgi:hypothetical protein
VQVTPGGALKIYETCGPPVLFGAVRD